MPHVEAVGHDADRRQPSPLEAPHESARPQWQHARSHHQHRRERAERLPRVAVTDDRPQRDPTEEPRVRAAGERAFLARQARQGHEHPRDEEEQRRGQRVLPQLVRHRFEGDEVEPHGEARDTDGQEQRGESRERAARETEQDPAEDGQQHVELELDHERPHHAIDGADGRVREVLREGDEAPPLAERAAVLLHDEQHDHHRVVEGQDPQRAVAGVRAQVHPAAPEALLDERPEQQVAGEREEQIHAESAAEQHAPRVAVIHRCREGVRGAVDVSGHHSERGERAQRLDPSRAVLARLTD